MPKKSNSEQNAQAFIQAARRQIIHSAIFAVAALGVIVFACYAWFAGNHSVSGTIGSIQMLGSLYELAGNGSSTADSGYGTFYNDSTSNFEFHKLETGDFSTDTTNWPYLEATGANQSIRWRLVDSEIENFNKTGISPGSSGTLSFYVIPKVAGTLSINFTLELTPLDDNGNKITEETLKNLLKGHLLFSLTAANGSKWVSWDGNNFKWQFEATVDNPVGTPQVVILHWMWKENLEDLTKEFSSDKISSYRELLFYNESGNIPTADDIKTAIDSNQLDNLTKLYNRADRYIGSQLTWLEVKLTAQPAS